MASERRIAGPESKNRGALLDAAEALMLEEGYAAVTSRRLAERAGLKPQLVHYYFRTMDDLFLAAIRRKTELGLAAQAHILLAPNPLRALWNYLIDNRESRLLTEYVALANHRKALQSEVAGAAQQILDAQVETIRSVLVRHGIAAEDLSPAVATFLIVGTSQLLSMHASLGVSGGRDDIIEFFERHISKLDGMAET
ncbi:TetR/AcrR family transcriptional regulator [Mycobacterium sp. SMC-18]|uniref:TetR/AcrR family transcriptional regulator n=1 Tax=Mycobacteriaceae TaxID=1762 RepID=UPI00299CE691|nr:helix-turn-helix domain-containing protein [Mycolicibacterium sp. 141076]MDX1879658.1 helix-turn-helix domain-containing protein [Mycolicibacterium sp. 141076]